MLGWEYPPYVAGGLGTHCYYLTKALAKLAKIYFITPHPIHKKIGNLEIVGLDITQQFKEKGKLVVYGKLRAKKIDVFTGMIREVIKKYDFDVIHCQDEHPIEASIIAKNISKKPLVCTIHSTVYDKSKKLKIRRFNTERKGMRNADKIIAVSNYTKDIIINKYKIDPTKIAVIPNAVEQKKAPPAKIYHKTKYVLCLGRVTYQKGIPYLIEAAAKVLKKEKNIKFIIVGEGRSKDIGKLKQKIRKLGLQNNFSFLGYVKDKEYYYRRSHIFVMPSVSEPFGITPLEAISNGTPAIISRQSGVAELLKSCMKFNYWDTDDLAKKIIFLLKNKQAYRKLRMNGIREVRNFMWENVAKETLKLYKKVLKLV